ncbi:MAG: NAD(P)/FAD-dependent oxidoreductase [Parvibaculaceae bacterium]
MARETKEPARRKKIAIVGSGIAGMSAAWLIDQTHDITLFEAGDHIGGHSNTVHTGPEHGDMAVDTGFIVYNEANYPNLVALFKHLGVPTKASSMSFGASIDDGRFEYSGTGLNGLFAQRGNVISPRFWAMIKDIARFYKSAPMIAKNAACLDLTLGEFLKQEKYSSAFVSDHIAPMGAAIWSTTAKDMLDYPLATFVRFFESHGLLNFTGRPQWRTVDGGSTEYVKRLTAPYADKIRREGVVRVHRAPDGVSVELASGERVQFDDVVIATHADEALALLAEPRANERQYLGAFRYTTNETYLHNDERLMPKRKRVWSSWNYISKSKSSGDEALTVSYWMNELQGLDKAHPLFVTLNPQQLPRERSIIRTFSYQHPLFDKAAIAAQRDLWALQGQGHVWFCGSYFGYGFHEDALQAGLAVGEQLSGQKRPWELSAHVPRIYLSDIPALAAD